MLTPKYEACITVVMRGWLNVTISVQRSKELEDSLKSLESAPGVKVSIWPDNATVKFPFEMYDTADVAKETLSILRQHDIKNISIESIDWTYDVTPLTEMVSPR